MNFAKLIFINLKRHRIRSLIGISGIAFGVAAMLTVLSVITGAIDMFEDILSNNSDYIVFEKNVSDLFFSSINSTQIEKIGSLSMVEDAFPILFGIVSSENHPVITCFGINKNDPRLANAKWLYGSPRNFYSHKNSVYLGSRAADFLEAKYLKNIRIGKKTFNVRGILQLENGFENGGVFMPLKTAQEYFHRDNYVSVFMIKLKHTNSGSEFKKQVETLYPDLSVLQNKEFSNSYSQFKILSATSWAIGACACLLGGMGVANTMIMSVFSRMREIAILVVCGFSKSQVRLLIFGETTFIVICGSILGLIGGVCFVYLLETIPTLNGYIQSAFNIKIIVGILVVAFTSSWLGALYPAWYASKIQPIDALRYE